MRCHTNRRERGAKRRRGGSPGEALQRRARRFVWQPFGRGAPRAPLGVERLAQAASLGSVVRLDWGPWNPSRTGRCSVNRPYTIVEIQLFPGRSLDAKRRLYSEIATRFGAFGIAPNDITIILHEPSLDKGALVASRPARSIWVSASMCEAASLASRAHIHRAIRGKACCCAARRGRPGTSPARSRARTAGGGSAAIC
ncbi:tautomerase family protein [Roseateles aquae]|uniref:tautomerase family protein n=1 Tax=Roseateles aquae TaxID=3077235 RepID=UPI003312FEE7